MATNQINVYTHYPFDYESHFKPHLQPWGGFMGRLLSPDCKQFAIAPVFDGG
jgi:hypothetical protein